MRAGRLQHEIQIERMVETVSPSGHPRKVWQPILTTRAEVKEASTTEFLLGQIEGDQSRVVFLIRYPSQPISTADRITWQGQSWNVTGLQEIGRRRGLEIRAEVGR